MIIAPATGFPIRGAETGPTGFAPRQPRDFFFFMKPILLVSGLAGAFVLFPACTAPDGGTAATIALEQPPDAAAENYRVSANAGPDELARLAVARHPSIRAARHRAERLAARVLQEAALPDPTLEFASGSMAETAAGRVEATGGVKQKFPFPGKRAASASAAASEAGAARAEIRAAELRLTEQVHAAWWDRHLAAETVRLTRESREILQGAREAVDSQVATGQATQADQLRLANELAELDRDLVEARELDATAAARLNARLNRPAGAALPPAAGARIPSPGRLDALLAAARRDHPEVAAAESRVSAFRHRLKRAELENYPDFSAGLSAAAVSSSGLSGVANGRDQIWASLGVEIPLWREPRRAAIREAREGIAETEALLEARRADLRQRIEDAWFRVRTARELTGLFSERLIPDARQAYEVTLTAYSAGEASFNDLIETWRTLLTYQLQGARNRVRLAKAGAALRAAAGEN